ncbi:bifunctional riboflavin kinase/FAD synthetase [Shimazuella sp. AN120528]|uniref:bifunctional riboflavin kinase/FAD synthetase n=1 Tax=Shimazuella soli TaxID=1892854 RepID=UPI001F0D0E46|nr:bifunctional riboflavin kinase/FAD synthetase [Shimazuella soli]MCH5586257.1 bifunctional riboflavin kinase/FAD synthetase [Shimazuella soli]
MKKIEITYPFDSRPMPAESTSLAIGFFDGLHLGHQAVINKAISKAKKLNITPAVMTFSPHPREVLGKTTFMGYLTPLKEKLYQLEQLGIEQVYVVTFNQAFANLEKEKFISNVLVPLNVSAVTTGFNFTFGHRGLGTANDLMKLGKSLFEVEIVDPIIMGNEAVSSTRTRNALSTGDISLANDLLGRPYRIQGEVVHGDKRGRQIGFPTANVEPDQPYYLPVHGVYVVRAYFKESIGYGIMNVGVRPTFDKSAVKTKLEVHLFGQSPHLDLYGEVLQVELLHYLRKEAKFSSVKSLVEQIELDRTNATQWLSDQDIFLDDRRNILI